MSGQVPISSGTMTGRVVVGASHDRPILHHASETRHVFTDADTWNVGRNFLEATSDVGRSVRFHVEGVELGGPTVLPDEDDRPPAAASGLCPLGPEEVRQGETKGTKRAGGDELAPADSVTEPPG